jgi:hypothetical protein
MIQAEGVESLSEYELRQACRERGHLGLLSTEEMRQQVCSVLLLLGHSILFWAPSRTFDIHDPSQIPNAICMRKRNLPSWAPGPG